MQKLAVTQCSAKCMLLTPQQTPETARLAECGPICPYTLLPCHLCLLPSPPTVWPLFCCCGLMLVPTVVVNAVPGMCQTIRTALDRCTCTPSVALVVLNTGLQAMQSISVDLGMRTDSAHEQLASCSASTSYADCVPQNIPVDFPHHKLLFQGLLSCLFS